MVHCCAYKCKSCSERKDPGITFHRFANMDVEDAAKEKTTKDLDNHTSHLAFLKERIEFYKGENAKMAAVLKKTGLFNTESRLNSRALQNTVESISKQEARLLDTIMNMSRAEMLRKHNNYVAKLRICIQMYSNLNNILIKEICIMRGKIHTAKLTVSDLNVSIDELQQLEQNSTKYETEVRKFEQKYPWLNDPDLNFPNIARETEKLQHLKELKEKLMKELSKYEGLKPDIVQASQQLAAIKEENRKINTQLHN